VSKLKRKISAERIFKIAQGLELRQLEWSTRVIIGAGTPMWSLRSQMSDSVDAIEVPRFLGIKR
jgi:hypothetical protein